MNQRPREEEGAPLLQFIQQEIEDAVRTQTMWSMCMNTDFFSSNLKAPF